MKNLAALCLCLENLYDAEFKRIGLVSLVEEVSEQHSIQGIAWLVLAYFSQVSREKLEGKVKRNFSFMSQDLAWVFWDEENGGGTSKLMF